MTLIRFSVDIYSKLSTKHEIYHKKKRFEIQECFL